MATSLDTLPNELKRRILRLALDVNVVSMLIHTSPSYHAVYLTFREEYFTDVTFNDLRSRQIDILNPISSIEISRRNNEAPDRHFRRTIEHCYCCIQTKQAILLSVPQGLMLSSITDLVGWSATTLNAFRIHDAVLNICNPTEYGCPRSVSLPFRRPRLWSKEWEHQVELPQNHGDYRCGFSNYFYVNTDVWPREKRSDCPSLSVKRLIKQPRSRKSLACRFRVKFEDAEKKVGG